MIPAKMPITRTKKPIRPIKAISVPPNYYCSLAIGAILNNSIAQNYE
jgi:hypothetical protein